MHVFSHKMKFWCVKQPDDTTKDAFYALHHMKACVRDQQNGTLPSSDLKGWVDHLQKYMMVI